MLYANLLAYNRIARGLCWESCCFGVVCYSIVLSWSLVFIMRYFIIEVIFLENFLSQGILYYKVSSVIHLLIIRHFSYKVSFSYKAFQGILYYKVSFSYKVSYTVSYIRYLVIQFVRTYYTFVLLRRCRVGVCVVLRLRCSL